jgi:Tfp pilus assembly protein PilF
MFKKLALVAGVVAMAAGCSSYSRTDKAQTQISFGSSVARRGLWREAAFRFERAVQQEPNNARALAEYKRALEIDPGDSYIRRNYARFAEFYTSYTRTTGKATGGS